MFKFDKIFVIGLFTAFSSIAVASQPDVADLQWDKRKTHTGAFKREMPRPDRLELAKMADEITAIHSPKKPIQTKQARILKSNLKKAGNSSGSKKKVSFSETMDVIRFDNELVIDADTAAPKKFKDYVTPLANETAFTSVVELERSLNAIYPLTSAAQSKRRQKFSTHLKKLSAKAARFRASHEEGLKVAGGNEAKYWENLSGGFLEQAARDSQLAYPADGIITEQGLFISKVSIARNLRKAAVALLGQKGVSADSAGLSHSAHYLQLLERSADYAYHAAANATSLDECNRAIRMFFKSMQALLQSLTDNVSRRETLDRCYDKLKAMQELMRQRTELLDELKLHLCEQQFLVFKMKECSTYTTPSMKHPQDANFLGRMARY